MDLCEARKLYEAAFVLLSEAYQIEIAMGIEQTVKQTRKEQWDRISAAWQRQGPRI